MNDLISQIERVLQQVFLPTAKKKAFVAKLGKFSEAKLERLLVLLQRVINKQNTFFLAYLKEHPELVDQMSQFVRSESENTRKEREAVSLQEDEAVLQDLEAELEDLFNEDN